jgi:hypothetical protein
MQWPLVQLSARDVSQATHAAPPVPQLERVGTKMQALPLQQPVRQVVEPQSVGWQMPFWHVPPEQTAPSGACGLEHWPVLGLQVPATWHWSKAVQTTGVPPEQTPAWHVAPCVQRLPLLQGLPSGAVMLEH